jgi:hypothetical protein
MDPIDHIVRVVEQVGFPIALVLVMIMLAPRYVLRVLVLFREIMDDFGDKLVTDIKQVADRQEALVNRSEAITLRQEAAVSRLEAIAKAKLRGGEDVNGKY